MYNVYNSKSTIWNYPCELIKLYIYVNIKYKIVLDSCDKA